MVRKKRSGEESGEEASPLHSALTAMPLALVFQRDPTLRLDGNQSEGYRRLKKISQDFPKFFGRQDERSRTFSKNFRTFPKIAEDFRGRSEDVLIIHQRI